MVVVVGCCCFCCCCCCRRRRWLLSSLGFVVTVVVAFDVDVIGVDVFVDVLLLFLFVLYAGNLSKPL